MSMNPSLLGALNRERMADLWRTRPGRAPAADAATSAPARGPHATLEAPRCRLRAVRLPWSLRSRAGWLLVGLGLRLALTALPALPADVHPGTTAQ